MPRSPPNMGLLGTAAVLATGVCLVLAALCRRHYSRPCPRPEGGTKHVPMEAVIAADDLIVDGSVTGVRTPATPDAAITAEAVRNGTSVEATDPDIIRNQYGENWLYFLQCFIHNCITLRGLVEGLTVKLKSFPASRCRSVFLKFMLTNPNEIKCTAIGC